MSQCFFTPNKINLKYELLIWPCPHCKLISDRLKRVLLSEYYLQSAKLYLTFRFTGLIQEVVSGETDYVWENSIEKVVKLPPGPYLCLLLSAQQKFNINWY